MFLLLLRCEDAYRSSTRKYGSIYESSFNVIQEFMDDFLGLHMSEKNRLNNSLLICPGILGWYDG
ncbi:hypothetical protein MASR1M31_11310 [Porphyromonadaceae bacterium]